MNSSVLSGLAAALSGGLKGYNSAKDRQRQEALDALQKQKMEQDDVLRRAALDAKAESERLAAENRRLSDENKARYADARMFQAPILSEINKYGNTKGTEEALGLTDSYLDAPKYQRFPVEGDTGMEQTFEEDGPVAADPTSFVQSKGDVLKARAAALTKKDGTATVPTLPNGRTPKEDEVYRAAKARQDGKAAGAQPTPPVKPVEAKFIETISNYDDKINQVENIVADSLKMGDKYPGFWGAKFNDWLRVVGKQDPGTTALVAQFKANVSQSVRAISGAAATDAERKFIAMQEPNEEDTLDTMLLKAYNAARFAKWKKANLLGNLKKGRRDVSGFGGDTVSNPMLDTRPPEVIIAEIKANGSVSGPSGPAGKLVDQPIPGVQFGGQ